MKVGRPRNIETPELMLALWDEYKAEVDSDPDVLQVATGKGVQSIEVKRPYLRQGFESFCFRKGYGNVHQYFKNQDNLYDEFMPVITHMRSEWEKDQIEGSLTGRYKSPNLVARLNGIADNSNHNLRQEQPLFPDSNE